MSILAGFVKLHRVSCLARSVSLINPQNGQNKPEHTDLILFHDDIWKPGISFLEG